LNKIIGRRSELQELEDAFSTKKAEMIVLYGRRRIGKTFLINEFFSKKTGIYFHVTGVQDGLLNEQLEEFTIAIGKVFYKGATIAKPNSWMKALGELNKAIENAPKTKKIILFFDELPWMVTAKSRLLQALDYHWNHYWSKNPSVKLIICGSSASWIIKNIINNKAGLHNRYTRSLLIKPFSLQETRLYLHSKNIKLNNWQILQLYMVMGGIPHYLDKIKKGISATQIIDYLCFNENGILFSEFDKLFKSLFDDAKTYIELIRLIAKTREGVSRRYLEEKSQLSTKGGMLSERLNNLELAGFIKSFLPLHHQRQGLYYRVIDEYSYFYLKWIEPEKQTLIKYDIHNNYWMNKATMATFQTWMGYAFESVCYKHISQIRKALNIPTGAKVGAWRYAPKRGAPENGAQIDLLFERDDGTITLCEIKCTEMPFAIDKKYYQSLLNKMAVYQKVTRSIKQLFVAFISANGLKKTIYSEEIEPNLVVLEDLFKEQ